MCAWPVHADSTPDQFTPVLVDGVGELACSDWLFVVGLAEDLSRLVRALTPPFADGSLGVVIALSEGFALPDVLDPPVALELPAPTANARNAKRKDYDARVAIRAVTRPPIASLQRSSTTS